MKKFLFTLIVFCTTCQFLLAQGDVKFGLSITPGMSWLRSQNDSIETRAKGAFGYGLIIDYEFAENERYLASSGLYISHTGGKYSLKVDSLSQPGVVNLKVVYLDIPLTLKLKTNQYGRFTPYGQIGLTPSIAIRRRFDYTVSGQEIISNAKANERTNNFNISLTVGLGTEYEISEDTAAFGALYLDNGLLNVIDDNDTADKVSRIMLGVRAGIYF